MRLLVTGGLGFIGANFVKYRLEHHPDDFVINLDKRTYAASPPAVIELDKYPNYELVRGDICNRKLVNQCVQGIDVVINFAAESHVDRSISSGIGFVRTNVFGTFVLLEEARKIGVKRFHHVSTDEVFGSLDLDSRAKFDEESKYNPRNPYSASKAASDFFVMAFHNTYGLNVTISNSSNNFGPFQHPEKLIPKAIINAIKEKRIPVYGDGRQVRDWIHVEDNCAAIDLILEKGKSGENYCVSAENEHSNIEVVRLVLDLMGKSRKLVRFVKDRPGHDRRYSLSSAKIRSTLGWKPKHNFRESLVTTIEWYSERRGFIGDSGWHW